MLSLQFLALEQMQKPYDDSIPQIRDMLFDVHGYLLDLDHEIQKNRKSLHFLRERFMRLKLEEPDLFLYNGIRDGIEFVLFDSFTCTTSNHIKWKEYFHNLYNLVIIPRTDRYASNILLFELLKYYDILKAPDVPVEYGDPNHHKVYYLIDAFRRLKAAHGQLVNGFDIIEKFREHMRLQTEYRTEYFEAKKLHDEQLALRRRYKKVLYE